jgi:hypothetical protein
VRVVSIIQAKRVQLFWQNNRGLSMANRRKSALGFPGFLCFPGFLVGDERFLGKTEPVPSQRLADPAFVAVGPTIRSLASFACLLVFGPATFLTGLLLF